MAHYCGCAGVVVAKILVCTNAHTGCRVCRVQLAVTPTPTTGLPIVWTVTGSAKGTVTAQGAYTGTAAGTDTVTAKNNAGVLLGSATAVVG
jgi:hypothetical protein